MFYLIFPTWQPGPHTLSLRWEPPPPDILLKWTCNSASLFYFTRSFALLRLNLQSNHSDELKYVWTWILTIIFAIVVAEKLHATSVSQYKYIFVVALIQNVTKLVNIRNFTGLAFEICTNLWSVLIYIIIICQETRWGKIIHASWCFHDLYFCESVIILLIVKINFYK